MPFGTKHTVDFFVLEEACVTNSNSITHFLEGGRRHEMVPIYLRYRIFSAIRFGLGMGFLRHACGLSGMDGYWFTMTGTTDDRGG